MTPSAIRKCVLSCCTGGVAVAAILFAPRFHRPAADAAILQTAPRPVEIRARSVATEPTRPIATPVARARARSEARARVEAPASPSSNGAMGMVIGIDPETGALGPPSAEQMREIQAHRATTMRATPDGFIEIHRPDGAVGLMLGDRGQSYSVVRITPEGRRMFGCVEARSDSAAAAAPLQAEDR